MSEHEGFNRLEAALLEQTAAINALAKSLTDLAESNRQVVDYLLAEEVEDGDAELSTTYLDGTPRELS